MKKVILLTSLVVLIFTSCKTSYITDTWKWEDPELKAYNKVLVLAIIREEDRALQQKMEEHMAGDLARLGYNAVSSYKEFGPKAFQDLTKEEAAQKIRKEGVDAVITIVLIKKDELKTYYPGRPQQWPSNSYYQNFERYYGTMWSLVKSPDYYVVNNRFSWESNFYDLGRADLIYSVQTQSFDPSSTESLAHEYGKMIVKNMERKKVVGKQPKLKAF
jgi:hypothetical protein